MQVVEHVVVANGGAATVRRLDQIVHERGADKGDKRVVLGGFGGQQALLHESIDVGDLFAQIVHVATARRHSHDDHTSGRQLATHRRHHSQDAVGHLIGTVTMVVRADAHNHHSGQRRRRRRRRVGNSEVQLAVFDAPQDVLRLVAAEAQIETTQRLEPLFPHLHSLISHHIKQHI